MKLSRTEERALVRRAQEGSAEAANRLAEALLPAVVRWAKNRAAYLDQVDEIVQEAMTGIFRGLHGFDRNRRLEPWCWKVTANAAARYKRADAVANQRAAEVEALHGVRLVERPDIDENIALEQALGRLDPELREVLNLLAEGASVRRIASLLGLSKSTAQRWKTEALDAIRKEMGTR